MSVERGWEGVQRQGQDIAERFSSLAQSFGCLLQSHLRTSGGSSSSSTSYSSQAADDLPLLPTTPSSPLPETPGSDPSTSNRRWPWLLRPHFKARGRFNRVQLNCRWRNAQDGGTSDDHEDTRSPGNSGIHELGRRLSQVGADLGANVGSFVTQFTKHLSSISQEDADPRAASQASKSSTGNSTMEYHRDYADWRDVNRGGSSARNDRVTTWKRASNGRQRSTNEPRSSQETSKTQDFSNEELFALFTKRQGQLHRQGSVNVTTTYDSRTQEVESSVTARGDLWRAEASHSGSISSNGSSPLFLLQIGPILFVRDTTLLLPIHLSKQHLLWYGFDRKNGMHSICPAVWSKHRRWLLMSMVCISPFTCSFLDLQFPNGQLTYVAGEGLTSSAFYPIFGGLLQAQGRRPGVTKLSYSKKMSCGTRLTPSLQLPEKSVSLDIVQPIAWQRTGIMVRPTAQLRVTPTIGGRNAGWRAEVVHSPKEKLSLACGCTLTIQPTAYASISLGKSKRNVKDSGSSGLVLLVEAPMENLRRVSFCIQLNSGVEF